MLPPAPPGDELKAQAHAVPTFEYDDTVDRGKRTSRLLDEHRQRRRQ